MRIASFLGLIAMGVAAIAHAQIAPTIASISSSQADTQGQSVTLSVAVNGTTPFTYEWRKDGTTIPGATTNNYAISALALSDAGSYTVVIGNTAGTVTGGPILLDVIPATAPSFSYQPSNVTYYVGSTISLYASVNGTTPLTFVWKKNGTTIATTSSLLHGT